MPMLRPEETIERVYLYRKPIDMRKQRTGLAALVQEVIKVDPFGGSLFVFTGRRNDRIKILWWSRNGFILALSEIPNHFWGANMGRLWMMSRAAAGRRSELLTSSRGI
jgi:hypothetical protein